MKSLIIVESKTKAKTISGFLNKDNYIVKSCLGHICNLDNKKYGKLGIDVNNNYKPVYTNISDKKKLIQDLKYTASKCSNVIIASDEDREGEAIAWHLSNILQIDVSTVDRIVFHEITKTAIQNALNNPTRINMSMVNAQQGRQVLDKLVGYTLSPMLWKNVKAQLSAGRVQSVCLRLIVEKESDVDMHKENFKYKIHGDFNYKSDILNCVLNTVFTNKKDVMSFLNRCVIKDKVFPKFNSGDTLKVHLKVKEGEKERIQVFEGICIAKKNAGINSSFTVRKISYGEGIERVLPLYSPQISKIELVKSGDVRRSKLYYLRSRSGKSARISEKSSYSENINTNNEEEKILENPKSSTNTKDNVKMEEKADKLKENKVDSNEKVDLDNKK